MRHNVTKVYLRPDVATIKDNNGIGRVVHAQARYLPQFDIELVGDPGQADVIAGHTHDHGADRIDACHIHGFYWTGDAGSGDYDNWHREANTRIVASVRRARAITVPSNWVGECLRRDMRISPTVIGHGIDFGEWAPAENGGYVLYGKNREGDVCRSQWAYELARRGIPVRSTFAPKWMTDKPAALTLTGELPAGEMKEQLRRADVYLATTKETFGIQTLEALACGVPVLGFSWGGTADIVEHERNGYLVPPGDIEGLLEGLQFIQAHRLELSVNAREAASGYAWERVIGRYAALYHELAGTPDPAGVAVVIPCHNYGRFVAQCIESVLAQTHRPEEIIVVDDGSTDDSREIVARYADRGVRLIAQTNSGVAAARNAGIAAARQALIVCLDADDMLEPRYVEVCRNAMRRDRGLGITWTGMSILRDGQRPTGNVWTGLFDWEWQATPGVPPKTSIPTGAMFRREMWERSGGYKQAYAPGEDAEFYTRGLSVGFTARQVTDMPFFLYRDHGTGAHKKLPYKPIDEWMPWMRDRQYPLAAPGLEAPAIRSYSEPKVSVVIPVGPGHGAYLPDALESLLGQNMRDWEAIVVDDTDGLLPEVVRRFPFVRLLASGARSPGAARNVGVEAARAPLVLFLDADDRLAPGALAAMCRAYAGADGRYIFGDWQPMGSPVDHREAEYNPAAWLDFDTLAGKHSITVLMATADARGLRFDERLTGWEDWDFFTRAALSGVQGQRVPQVTLYVRQSANGRTAQVMRTRESLLAQLKGKYGGATMAKSCCGGNADALLAAKAAWTGTPAEKAGGLTNRQTTLGRGVTPVPFDPNVTQSVRMEFTGSRSGAVTYHGARGSGRQYRGGNNPINRFHNVHPEDVAPLEATGDWRRVAPVLSEITGGPAAPQTPAAPAVALSVPEPEPVLELATVGEVAAPAVSAPELAAPVETVQVVQTADGPVKRKRTGAKKTAKNTPLKELPPVG